MSANKKSSNYKLVPPQAIEGAILRAHLIDTVLASPRYRVVLVQAPAGHGKTTLLQQVMAAVQDRRAATAWMTLEESDDDPTRFLHQLHELIDDALERVISPGDLARVEPLHGFGPVEELLDRFNQFDRPLAFFIDEFQVVQNDVVVQLFARLLERLPSHVTVYLGSRSVPAIGLSRLVIRGTAIVLDTEAVRFTREETAQFFSDSLHAVFDRALVDELHARTEGWPAALQLARLALRGGADKRIVELLGFSNEPAFEDYLANNVLAAQPERIREFLLETSILDRLSPELCADITGRDDAEASIRFLERGGLFIRPVDAERRWYRYHSLFSGYLRKQLRRRKPAAPQALHHAAARWFLAHGFPEDAINHAVEASDFALAAEILQTWSEQLVREARLATIERWLDVLPLAEVRQRPALQMKVLWALLFLRRFHKARPLLDALLNEIEKVGYARATTLPLLVSVRYLMEDDIAAAGLQVIGIDVDREAKDRFESFELGAIANIQSLYLRTLGDFAAAQTKAESGAAHSEYGEAVFSGAYAMAFLGNAYLAQARLQEALRTYKQGFEAASRPRGSYASAVVAACYAEALYYANEIDQAKVLLEDTLPLIRQACMPDALAIAHITLAKILQLKNHEVDADYMLREAEKIASVSGLPRVSRLIKWERVRQLLARDEVEEAREQADRILGSAQAQERQDLIFHGEELGGGVIGYTRLLVHERKHEAALQHLADPMTTAARDGRVLRWLKLRMLEANALDLAGRAEAAHTALLEVTRITAGEGLTRFVNEETSFMSLLARVRHSEPKELTKAAGRLLEYIDCLLASGSTAATGNIEEAKRVYDTLSQREIEILGMLSRGISNKRIGVSLFVSENTVKYHLRNIYTKLGVKNRTEASNLALRLRIVD